ncbi:hypothetical protein PR202_ga29383 [Eleusine coracana subsp. coracana]|uniref:Uncharacterized protein n=1 Tax=Eleusine coracana subsp. coracana TaxID=191504 RepID=A0AAV5DLH2_ELECO|nr:hypothetical protein PR202_ga29383 [Eleusine coracana subsp. coracana]
MTSCSESSGVPASVCFSPPLTKNLHEHPASPMSLLSPVAATDDESRGACYHLPFDCVVPPDEESRRVLPPSDMLQTCPHHLPPTVNVALEQYSPS